jgi:endonuclease/exonuclease/phosphatase family metal-dependent hydrolase
LRKCVAVLLALTEIFLLLAASAAAAFFLQPYGQRIWLSLVLGASLAIIIIASRTILRKSASSVTRIRARFTGPVRLGANVLGGTLIGWLGLIGWSSLSAGGAMPPGKSDAQIIRVVTWNILHGTEAGLPWNKFGWPVRKGALEAVLRATAPDILCVQEALDVQVIGLASFLARHGHVGVGRDDGRSAGEYCAIFFDRRRFEQLDNGTFWLEEPTNVPPQSTLLGPKRICTWVRLRDRTIGRPLRVYNAHSYLSEKARLKASRIIIARIDAGDPADAVLVTADFNAEAHAPSRLLFENAGLESSARLAGASLHIPTYQFYGIRLSSFDDVLVNGSWQVRARQVLDAKPGNTFPSDHFGVMADLTLKSVEAQRTSD